MFHPTADQPTRLQPGDFVRFAPISTDEFHEIALQEQDVHPR
jgi:allophanate hydrolase subunit 1